MPNVWAVGRGRLRSTFAQGRERGSVAVFVAAVVPGLLVVFGLVLDLGQELRAQRTAQAAAQEAARAGAESVNLAAYRRGSGIVLDAAAASAAARAYLSAAGYPGSVSVAGGSTLTVTVTVTQPTQVLGLIGITSWTATETAHAQLREG